MKNQNKQTGVIGEKIAGNYLKKARLAIIACNYKTPFGEIDIIAWQNRTLVFIEVKTRTSVNFGCPLLAITESKKRHIVKNAVYYLKKYNIPGHNVRFDAVSIMLTDDLEFVRYEHVKNIIILEEDHLCYPK